ncbi:signal-regulatory protein beta-2 [Lates calcarifer]|uniref:Signal-regulatory protein beta-2 n=1 Tax=Lates calcarifer TaxID=8187 RepID=A0AAJ7LSJ4_LATCA|nr:signal-regulatory protein beta-2 [Lates calcarifer]XP_018550547.2 signal-regulatory protein beta-2 [Lates calcarifer]
MLNTMTAPVFVLCLICLFLGRTGQAQLSDISQPDSFKAVELGDTVTITCHIHSPARHIMWYKLTTGKRLQPISVEPVATTDRFYNLTTFNKEPHRYSVKYGKNNNHLSISATTGEDVGTYYCGLLNVKDIQFGSGTFLMVKGLKMISDSIVQQPESTSVQPGDSVTLSCSVHTGHCAAEHTSVMWLKHSDHAAPETIYSSGNKNNTCQRTKKDSEETTCVYNLLLRNLSSDDAGTYYCVVTSYGQTLLGNGTRINIFNNMDFGCVVNHNSGGLALITIPGVLLAFLIYVIIKTATCCHTESSAGLSTPPTTNVDASAVQHAALKEDRSERERDDTWSESNHVLQGEGDEPIRADTHSGM